MNVPDSAREDLLSEGREGTGPVIYWMQREMRAVDNWGLVHARPAQKIWDGHWSSSLCSRQPLRARASDSTDHAARPGPDCG